VTAATPTVSVGLPVRNACGVVGRCIDSVLSQDFTDLELVISDNRSDDGTRQLLEEYTRSDPRARLNVNEADLGIHANVNRVLELSRGTYFRWISSDDWLEPGCLSACVSALQTREDAIGVTTNFTIHTSDWTRYEEYRGEFPNSPDPARRFERMLWFFHTGDAKYDPLYGVYRRDVLLRSRRQHGSEETDWLLAAELALRGPIIHLDRRLSNRTKAYRPIDRAEFRRRLDPVQPDALKSSAQRLYADLLAVVMAADLTESEVRRCKRALRRFWVKDLARRGRRTISEARHRILGGEERTRPTDL
jgi:glycosyltransferase involved in cell wall biosynthesis